MDFVKEIEEKYGVGKEKPEEIEEPYPSKEEG
jgi:hypothetical protein